VQVSYYAYLIIDERVAPSVGLRHPKAGHQLLRRLESLVSSLEPWSANFRRLSRHKPHLRLSRDSSSRFMATCQHLQQKQQQEQCGKPLELAPRKVLPRVFPIPARSPVASLTTYIRRTYQVEARGSLVRQAMKNRDTDATWKYHEATKHSYWSIRTNTHFLDWLNRPLPFKVYPTIEPLPLPGEVPQTGVAALSAISDRIRSTSGDSTPDLQDLARILYFSAGITKERKHPGGEVYFRAAACTGALYEIELYVVTGDLSGLDAGVYHFNPADISLRLLRKGNFRGNLAQATAMERAVAQAPTTIICTGTYWRNAWKYQARTYRHFGWDNGTLLANMLAVTRASGLPAEIVLGFVDTEVNRLLDVDMRREVSLCLVPIGRLSEGSLPVPKEAPALSLETIPLSRRETEYPAMLDIHEASALESAEEVARWREQQPVLPRPALAGELLRLPQLPEEEQSKDTIEQVILRRGSTRAFDKAADITLSQLSTILDYATRGLPADFLNPAGTQLNDLYLIVHSVQELKSGAYFFQREQNSLELLKEGEFRAEACHLGLEQELPAYACVDIFFLADLRRILERYGNRGYRAVQLEAGTIGGRIYLATYAQYLGATGLTFFDDDVTNFFSPHARDKSAIFLLAIGKPLKREPRLVDSGRAPS
jgi:SagB-type dehydrogenase family enzyme